LDWRSSSRFYTLSDEELAESIARSSKVLRAVFPGEQCRFAVLTFASGGEFFNLAKLTEVKEALQRLGINKTVLYRASGSDDWQLFIWFTDWINTSEIRSAFSRWLSRAGLAYSQSLILYPGSEQPLPLPLQSGFAWLDDQGSPALKREDLTREKAIELFLDDMADNGNPWEAVSRKFSNPFLRALPKQESSTELEGSPQGDQVLKEKVEGGKPSSKDKGKPSLLKKGVDTKTMSSQLSLFREKNVDEEADL
jgi:hypothetical protein